jgi:uncharacterized protein
VSRARTQALNPPSPSDGFPPARLWPRRLLIAGVQGYRLLLKPWLGNACRFEPSCSAYALQALEVHGAAAGSLLTGGRILRCHPWCEGGIDPVPAPGRGLFGRLGLHTPTATERDPTSAP